MHHTELMQMQDDIHKRAFYYLNAEHTRLLEFLYMKNPHVVREYYRQYRVLPEKPKITLRTIVQMMRSFLNVF